MSAIKENPQIVRGQSEDIKQKDEFDLMKARLVSYRTLNEEIDNERERLDRMQMKAKSAGGANLTGMPKSHSPVYDRMADVVSKIVDLEAEITALVKKRDDEAKSIEALVKKLNKAGEKAIIRSRYLDLEEWEDVLFVLFGNKEDFDDKYEDYKQKMFRWHRAAITNLAGLSQ